VSGQYLRKASLVVASLSDALDLSAFRFTFETHQWDLMGTPNHVIVRVYNLSDQTVNKIISLNGPNAGTPEYTRLILQAGYEDGPYGTIFDGTIAYYRVGRESPTDTYLDITTVDGDEANNFGVVNQTLAAGATPNDQISTIVSTALSPYSIKLGWIPPTFPAQPLPRGKVLFGMARKHLRDIANTNGMRASIQNGQLQFMPLTSYLPGQAVVLNSYTGMIGIPEQTQGGIQISSLLNPNFKVNGAVQIDNKSIQSIALDPSLAGQLQIAFAPIVTADGFYRILVLKHRGDTRGNDWYSDMVCVGINQAAPPGLTVKGYG